MSDRTHISWTSASWNPVTGCDRVSEGCDHCYALALAKRLKAMGNPRYQVDGDPSTSGPGFGVTLHPDKLEEPFHWRHPRRVFVNSMSDLFHDDVPADFIARVFAVMAMVGHHRFQVLTKRPGRMASLIHSETFRAQVQVGTDTPVDTFPWPLPNVWLGVSVENQRWADIRIPKLLKTPAAVRFLSCEPLLGRVDVSRWLEGVRSSPWPAGSHSLHWVIVGGESGKDFRPMNLTWARAIRDQCLAAGVPFFYKQGSGIRPEMDRSLDGRRWEQMPDVDLSPVRA